jgi:hypothetical protein
MSVNLGNDAMAALRDLANDPRMEAILIGMRVVAQNALRAALTSPPDIRLDVTGYARGIDDFVVAFEAAVTNVRPQAVMRQRPASPTMESVDALLNGPAPGRNRG